MKNELFDKVNANIINHLEDNDLFWRKNYQSGLPQNFITKHYYNGINFISLLSSNTKTNQFATFLQYKEKNIQLNAGSKGTLILFWKLLASPTADEPEREIPFLRYSYVFPLSSTNAFTEIEPKFLKPQQIMRTIIEKHYFKINFNIENRAYYNPSFDYISIPCLNDYENEESYWCDLFHEIIHATGHETRLKRDLFNNNNRAKEELTAEIGGTYLLNICGIENTHKEATAYIKSWLKHLNNDKAYFFEAASKAKEAVLFLIGELAETELN